MKKQTLKKVSYIILCIIWAFVIFYLSGRNYYESNNTSIGIIYKFISAFSNVVKLSDEQVINIITFLNLPIRKLAHMTEYFILALLIFNLLKNHNLKNKKYYFTLFICFIYALLDEYHQSFISGRTSQFIDCLIDISGSTLYLYIVYKVSKKKKLANKKRFKQYY